MSYIHAKSHVKSIRVNLKKGKLKVDVHSCDIRPFIYS